MKIGLLGLFAVLLISASHAAELDTSQIKLMAYYQVPETAIDLNEAKNVGVAITDSTEQYFEGMISVWQLTGDDYESTVHVRVRTDGWIVTWLDLDDSLKDLPLWEANANTNITTTALAQAINDIATASSTTYDPAEVKYYSYQYPNATNVVITGTQKYVSNTSSTVTWNVGFGGPSVMTFNEGVIAGASTASTTNGSYSTCHAYFTPASDSGHIIVIDQFQYTIKEYALDPTPETGNFELGNTYKMKNYTYGRNCCYWTRCKVALIAIYQNL